MCQIVVFRVHGGEAGGGGVSGEGGQRQGELGQFGVEGVGAGRSQVPARWRPVRGHVAQLTLSTPPPPSTLSH